MPLEVKINHPGFPEGYELELAGVGVFPNGSSVTLTEDQERAYIIRNGQTLKDAVAGNDSFKVTGTPLVKSVKDGLDGDVPAEADSPAPVADPVLDNDDN